MNEYNYKSVQDLIVKAAIYDGVSTTIRREELIGSIDTIRIIFEKNNRYSSTYVYLGDKYTLPENAHLCNCKRALYKLLEAPYEDIKCTEENQYEKQN
jgi:hypothetical protein